MLVSYRWLTELLPHASLDAQEVADALTGVGLAVDGVVNHEDALRPVLLVEVLKIERRNTEKLLHEPPRERNWLCNNALPEQPNKETEGMQWFQRQSATIREGL